MMKWISNAVVNWLKQKRPLPRMPLSNFERIRHEVKPCDVILVEGRSRVSDVIKLITQSNWSHAFMYIGRMHDVEDPQLREKLSKYYTGNPDKQLIIESELGMGTVVRPLTVYEGEHLRICRPRGLGFNDSQKVVAHVINRLGNDYNVRQIFDLARFLFPWTIMPRKWRSSLFSKRPGETTKTVCSTMIAEAFGHIQFPLLPLVKREAGSGFQLYMRNPKLCTPSDFDYSPYFDIIKYPFLDFHQESDQRLLPWQAASALNAEEREMYISIPQDSKHLNDDTQ